MQDSLDAKLPSVLFGVVALLAGSLSVRSLASIEIISRLCSITTFSNVAVVPAGNAELSADEHVAGRGRLWSGRYQL